MPAKGLTKNRWRYFFEGGSVPKLTTLYPVLDTGVIPTNIAATDGSHGEEIIWFIENYLLVPDGPKAGEPFLLDEFQKKFIRACYEADPDTGLRIVNEASLSTPRKNGKSGLSAAWLVAETVGPWCGTQSVIVASNKTNEAETIYDYAKLIVKRSGLEELSNGVKLAKCNDGRMIIKNLRTEGKAKVISGNADTAYSLNPDLSILDELGHAKNRDMLRALSTSGGVKKGLLVIIGTRGGPNSPLNEIIDVNQKPGAPKTSIVHLYAADENDDPLDPEIWAKANPGLGTIRDPVELAEFAEAAKTDPAKMADLKALYLNMPIDIGILPFLSLELWNKCKGEAEARGLAYGGLDLAQTNDLTSFYLYWPETGRIWGRNYITRYPLLSEREAVDALPYSEFMDHIRIAGEQAADYEIISTDISELCAEYDVVKIGMDPWKHGPFVAAAEKIGAQLPEIEKVGQMYKGMSPCINATERVFMEGFARHGDDPILRKAVANADLMTDGQQGNKMFSKKGKSKSAKVGFRIDPAVALSLAVGMATQSDSGQTSLSSMLTDDYFERMRKRYGG